MNKTNTLCIIVAMKTGRPTKYTPELASYICEQIMEGKSLPEICEVEGMPHRRTVIRWMSSNPTFATECARAREEQADFLDHRIQNVIDKAERGDIPSDVARVVISGLQWRAAKLKPKVYSDKTIFANDSDNPMNMLAARLDEAIAKSNNLLSDDASDLV